ncbi:MAG: ABC transporter transmembrane domain-containing protein, partial [Pseudomonadota bacterium]
MTSQNTEDGAPQRQAEWRIVKRVVPYFWPKDKPWVRYRVVAALMALFVAKLIGVATPYFYKLGVDVLAGEADGTGLAVLGAVGLTMAYGTMRLLNIVFQQLRDVIFAKVAQRALRDIGLATFRHIHDMSMRYHITRKTGGLSRVMERGVKGVAFLVRFLVFSIGPLILELALIAVALAWFFDWRYLVVIVVAIVAYVWFTFVVTEWRVRIRREMNDQDTDANQKAIDSLLNFETVKYFGAEAREADRYDGAMALYEQAALKT